MRWRKIAQDRWALGGWAVLGLGVLLLVVGIPVSIWAVQRSGGPGHPETDEGIEALMKSKQEADDERYGGPYLENDIVVDPWSQPFNYRSPGEFHEDGYDLWSSGPDMKDDGGKEDSDDIKNWIEK